MDLKTMTVEQLKVFVYDQSVIAEDVNSNIRAANEEIKSRTVKEFKE